MYSKGLMDNMESKSSVQGKSITRVQGTGGWWQKGKGQEHMGMSYDQKLQEPYDTDSKASNEFG